MFSLLLLMIPHQNLVFDFSFNSCSWQTQHSHKLLTRLLATPGPSHNCPTLHQGGYPPSPRNVESAIKLASKLPWRLAAWIWTGCVLARLDPYRTLDQGSTRRSWCNWSIDAMPSMRFLHRFRMSTSSSTQTTTCRFIAATGPSYGASMSIEAPLDVQFEGFWGKSQIWEIHSSWTWYGHGLKAEQAKDMFGSVGINIAPI